MTLVGVRNLGSAVVASGPAEPALIDLSTGYARRYAYADIERLSDAVGRGLLRRGLRRGDRVAVLAANSAEYLLIFLGSLRAGLVCVPVNHKLPAATVAFVLQDCAPPLVICDAARRGLIPDGGPALTVEDDFEQLLDEGPLDPVQPADGEAAMFLYTSGSTGRPKGVVLSHDSHLWVLRVRARTTGPPGRRALVAAPLYHMNALAMSQATLACGGTIVLQGAFTPASYIRAAADFRVHALTAVPTMIAMMLREQALLAEADLSAVAVIRIGSAPLSQTLADQIEAVFPNAELLNGYGTTEAGPVVFAPHPDGLHRPALSVGVAHPEVSLRLRRNGAIVDDEGVLEMRCPAMMSGYHNLPEATRKAITPDGHYVTGDVFHRDAHGFFFFVGRADDMFVCGGENIYPGEVEKMLERHPAVHQVSVVSVPDELKGEKPVAFIVKLPGAVVTEQAIKQFALANAPAYQHPRRVWFLDELPLAGTNKIDRRRLRELAFERMQ